MTTILELLKLYGFHCKMKLSRGLQYRVDFLLGLLVSFGLSSLGPIFQYLIFTQTRGYPNWNIKQIILYQGVLLLFFGIKDVLFGEIRVNLEAMIKTGEFDMILLKPYPSIGIILSRGFYYQGFGTIIAGIIIIIYSIQSLSLQIRILQVGLFISFLISGIILYMAITVMYCAITLLLVHMNRLGDILERFYNFSHYPVDIFFPAIRITFVVIIPLAAWVYFPTQALLNRVDIIAIASASVCILIFTISLIIWKSFLKKYTSAGG